MAAVLVTWMGAADLRAARGEAAGEGPVAQAIASRTFNGVVLLSNYASADEKTFTTWLAARTQAPIEVRHARLRSPTDFHDIHRAADSALAWASSAYGRDAKLTFHLSPGTPAMQAIWILLAPRYGATLIQSSREAGVEAVDLPFEIAAEFIPALVRQGDARLERLAGADRVHDPSFEAILYRSDAMRHLVERARQAAPYQAPILIEGESGTGKELLAAAIHRASGRKGDLIAVNCGALPADLVESAFFGHKKGSFTGAVADQAGHFESAAHGTLFLDEIGELPIAAQAKLLRALQEKKVRRVGDTKDREVEVRVIAATNRDLLGEVAHGRFREDLYYRLAVLLLKTPPLREREGDILLLASQHLDKLNEIRPFGPQKKISPAAKALLQRQPWPGNVRELQATLLRAFVWARSTTIDEVAIADALVADRRRKRGDLFERALGQGFALEGLLGEVARHYLKRALDEAQGNKTKAAALIGLASQQTLTNWLKKYKVTT